MNINEFYEAVNKEDYEFKQFVGDPGELFELISKEGGSFLKDDAKWLEIGGRCELQIEKLESLITRNNNYAYDSKIFGMIVAYKNVLKMCNLIKQKDQNTLFFV